MKLFEAEPSSPFWFSGHAPCLDRCESSVRGLPHPFTLMRILVIEDEVHLARHIASALMRHGHSPSVRFDGGAGLQSAITEMPDMVVLDLNLPKLDGFTVLSRLRAVNRTVRVLILTARTEVEHRVRGLRTGADDYLAKPFSMDELVARVEALGRRGVPPGSSDLLKVGDLVMNVPERTVTRGDQPVVVSQREYEVLRLLMQEPGRIFSRTELCERVWHRDYEYDTRVVEMFVARLRRKIDAGSTSPLLHTVRAEGYTLREPAVLQTSPA